jgi:DNA-binding response OmpR family regulator
MGYVQTVLMIEPNLVLANQYREMIEQQGVQVKWVESVQEAIRYQAEDKSQQLETILLSPRCFSQAGAEVDQEESSPQALAHLIQSSGRVVLLDRQLIGTLSQLSA